MTFNIVQSEMFLSGRGKNEILIVDFDELEVTFEIVNEGLNPWKLLMEHK